MLSTSGGRRPSAQSPCHSVPQREVGARHPVQPCQWRRARNPAPRKRTSLAICMPTKARSIVPARREGWRSLLTSPSSAGRWTTSGSSRSRSSAEPVVQLVMLSGNLKSLAADLEKPCQLPCIGGLLHRRAQHLAGHQQLPRKRVGLLLCQLPIAMPRMQEVVSKLMRDREPLTHDRIIRIDLDYFVDQTGAQLAERAALADIKAALARERMHDYRGTGDAVLA